MASCYRDCYYDPPGGKGAAIWLTAKASLNVQRKTYWQHLLKNGKYSSRNLEKLNIVEAQTGRVVAKIPLDEGSSNSYGTTYGGWISSLVDVGGSLAIASHGLSTTGVSTDISVSFIRSSKAPQIITMESECLKLGKTLAYTDVKLSVEGKLVAVGRHTKYIAQAWEDLEQASRQASRQQ